LASETPFRRCALLRPRRLTVLPPEKAATLAGWLPVDAPDRESVRTISRTDVWPFRRNRIPAVLWPLLTPGRSSATLRGGGRKP